MKIDIRDEVRQAVDKIVFADETLVDGRGDRVDVAFEVQMGPSNFMYLNEGCGGDTVRVGFDDVPNLVKALQRAVELWKE